MSKWIGFSPWGPLRCNNWVWTDQYGPVRCGKMMVGGACPRCGKKRITIKALMKSREVDANKEKKA